MTEVTGLYQAPGTGQCFQAIPEVFFIRERLDLDMNPSSKPKLARVVHGENHKALVKCFKLLKILMPKMFVHQKLYSLANAI